MPVVEINGQELEFPDDMHADDIKSVLRKKFPPIEAPLKEVAPETGRTKTVQDALTAMNSGQQGKIRTGAQILGQGINSEFDAIGDTISEYTPDIVKQAIGSGMRTAGKLPAFGGGTVGQKLPGEIAQISQGYSNLAEEYPALARDASALGAFASLMPAPKVAGALAVPATKIGSGLEKLGGAIEKSGVKSAQTARNKYLQSLITPKETPTVANEMFSRSKEKGLLRNRVTEPNAQEQDIVKTLAPLPVNGRNSLLKNYNIIENENIKEAQSLMTKLSKSQIPISQKNLDFRLAQARQNVLDNLFIGADGSNPAEDAINLAIKHINQNQLTASGVLQARKEFDAAIRKMKGDGVFVGEKQGQVQVAVQQVRQALNDSIAEAVPNAAVKESLRKQSNLYRAMDNIETKGGAEGKNVLSRFGSKVINGVPGKTAQAKAAVATTAAGLGLGGVMTGVPVLPMALTGAAGYGAYKGITSPALRKGVGKVISKTGKALKK